MAAPSILAMHRAMEERERLFENALKNASREPDFGDPDEKVLLGGFNNKNDKNAFPIPGSCTLLPLPGQQHPELLAEEASEPEEEAGLSCADLALRGAQGLAVNQQVAAIAADYLLQMLVYGALVRFQTYFEQGSGTMRSTWITPANLEGYDLITQPHEEEAADGEDDDEEDEILGREYEGDEDGAEA